MPIVGDVLADRYRIEGRLGAGGMASVWRARDLRLDRDVAIKVLLPNLAADPAVAQRFDREARSLAAAAHPSVIAVFDVEPGDPESGREPFYVMELADGGSLAERLAGNSRLEPRELTSIVGAVADGLAELHGRGMIHRDVKPHNIVFAGGRPKLADFGLVRSGDAADLTALTQTGTAIGTLAYLAPELLGGTPASPASDVYALAVVAFQGLTGRLPKAAGSITEVVEGRTLPAARASEVAPELGTGFDAPLAAALSIDPAGRPSPMGFAEGLSAALTLPSIPAIPPPPRIRVSEPEAELPTWAERTVRRTGARTPAEPRRPRPAIVALSAFAVVVLLLLGATSLLGRPIGSGSATPSPAGPGAVPTVAPSAPTPSEPAPPSSQPPTPPPDGSLAAALESTLARIAEAEAAGLGRRDSDHLRKRVEEVRSFVERGDERRAADRADRLVSDAQDVEDALPDEVAEALVRAAESVRASLPSSG